MKKVKKPRYYQQCPFCFKKAFEYLIKPYPKMAITYSVVKTHKGAKPKAGDKITCQHCKSEIGAVFLRPKYTLTT